MDPLVVVTHAAPVRLEARPVEFGDAPENHVALGFYAGDRLVARGVVPLPAVLPLENLFRDPVTIALAATEDDEGNIDARVCVVLPMPPGSRDDEPVEPWKASVPDLPPGIEAGGEDGPPRMALLPLGNVVRSATNRRHADVSSDAVEMLENLLVGHGRDAVTRAIDDLLDSI